MELFEELQAFMVQFPVVLMEKLMEESPVKLLYHNSKTCTHHIFLETFRTVFGNFQNKCWKTTRISAQKLSEHVFGKF